MHVCGGAKLLDQLVLQAESVMTAMAFQAVVQLQGFYLSQYSKVRLTLLYCITLCHRVHIYIHTVEPTDTIMVTYDCSDTAV